MKNLKRVLSLGLTSVMLLGMMVVGASAKDFTDAEDIIHGEAVETMVALNIIAGKEDGSYFAPKDNVTRGEMAKMIAVMMNGGNDVNTGVKGVPTFTDIKGHWAEPYIEYCADMGYISGRGDGTFDPNGNVTATEAAKMVLTSMGYDAKAYHLEGAAWASQTLERARTTEGCKLVEGLGDVVFSEAATRDTAAQLIWNGLQAYVITNTPDQNMSNGEVTWQYKTDGHTTLLEQRYDAYVMRATYTGNHDYGSTGADKGEIAVYPITADQGKKLGTKTLETTTFTFPSDMTIDNISEEVKVVWKNGSKSTLAGPDKNDTIFGVFNTGATRVVRSQLSKVNDNKSSKQIISIDGVKYDLADSVKVVTNFCDDQTYTRGTKNPAGTVGDYPWKNADGSINNQLIGDEDADKNGTLVSALKFNSGDPIKVTFDDNKVSTIYVTHSYAAAVTAVNSTSITLSNGLGKLDFADHDIEDGLEKGDVVAVTPLYDKVIKDGVVTVKKAEKVTGELESFKGKEESGKEEDENVVLGGKTYKINYKNKATPGVSFMHSTTSFSLLDDIPGEDNEIPHFWNSLNTYVGKDLDLYLVNGYVVAAVKVTDSSDYYVVTEVKSGATAGSTFDGLQLQVVGMDGTKEIITVSKDSKDNKGAHPTHSSAAGIGTADFEVGDIITFSWNDDDEADVVLEAMVTDDDTITYNEKTKTVSVNGTSYPTTSDCVLFVQTEGTAYNNKKVADAEWECYTIRDLDNINPLGTYESAVAKNNDNKVEAVFINLKNTPDGAEDTTVYGIVSNYNGRVKDYYSYQVQSNGEEYTILCKEANNKVIEKGDLVSFRPTADGKYSAGKVKVANETLASDGVSKALPLFYGWLSDYDSKADTISIFRSVTWDNTKKNFVGEKDGLGHDVVETYSLDSDVKIIYVDRDGSKSESEGGINEFSAIYGGKNVAFKTKQVQENGITTEVISIMFVETSNKVDIETGEAPAKANASVDNYTPAP